MQGLGVVGFSVKGSGCCVGFWVWRFSEPYVRTWATVKSPNQDAPAFYGQRERPAPQI